jgi:hypothetical protein
MAPKQFHAPRDSRPPLDFEITYSRFVDGEWEDETQKFRARPTVPGALMLRIASTIDGQVGAMSGEIIKLLEGAIWPEDRVKFNALLDDPETAIGIEVLVEILGWLIEEYAERPTQRPLP